MNAEIIGERGTPVHQIAFRSTYYFGDLIEYHSRDHGRGRGQIIDITLSDDGAVYYTVRLEDGHGLSGIYPDQMTLIEKHTPKAM